MIKLEELRVGNWVATGNFAERVMCIERTVIGDYCLDFCVMIYNQTSRMLSRILHSDISAIVLDGIWLRQMGFTHEERNNGLTLFVDNSDFCFKWNSDKKKVELFSGSTYLSKDCAFVHELQNLYFVLFGTELLISSKYEVEKNGCQSLSIHDSIKTSAINQRKLDEQIAIDVSSFIFPIG